MKTIKDIQTSNIRLFINILLVGLFGIGIRIVDAKHGARILTGIQLNKYNGKLKYWHVRVLDKREFCAYRGSIIERLFLLNPVVRAITSNRDFYFYRVCKPSYGTKVLPIVNNK